MGVVFGQSPLNSLLNSGLVNDGDKDILPFLAESSECQERLGVILVLERDSLPVFFACLAGAVLPFV